MEYDVQQKDFIVCMVMPGVSGICGKVVGMGMDDDTLSRSMLVDK